MTSIENKDLASAEEKSESTSGSKTTKCILIYEDDAEILILCRMLLEKENYRVETLAKCDNVLNDIALIKPDLILMDLWIPEIGGERAVTILKENKISRHIPVLLFSANDKIKEISAHVKADGYISKPFDINDFKEIIAKNI